MTVPLRPSIARSGTIASGQVGWPHLASGAVRSGHIGITGGTPDGSLFLRDDFSWATAGGGSATTVVASGTTEEIISGVRAVQLTLSGTLRIAMASVHSRMPAVGLVKDNVASGATAAVYKVGSFQFTSGLVDYSGYAGSLFVGRSGHPVSISGSWNSGGFLSGDLYQQIGVPFNSGGMVLNLDWALQEGFVLSGNIASGQIGTFHHSSGAGIDISQYVTPLYSGVSRVALPITGEIVSGVRGVYINTSGAVVIAKAGLSGRYPAIGVVVDNVASGIPANVVSIGAFQFTSGMADYSGYLGQQVFLGRSGQVVTISGSWNSGGLLSGDVQQPLGDVFTSGGVLFRIAAALPFTPTFVYSGDIASGQVGPYHIASGVFLGVSGIKLTLTANSILIGLSG